MRFKNLEDYQPSPGEKSGWRYTGAYYVPVLQGQALRRRKWQLSLLCLALLLPVYGIGRLDTPGFRQLYVIAPFLLLMYFCGRALISALSLFMWRESMTLRQHKQSYQPLRGCLRAAPWAAAALIVADMVYVFLGGAFMHEWPLLALAALLIALCYYTLELAQGLGITMQAQGKPAAQDTLIGTESTSPHD